MKPVVTLVLVQVVLQLFFFITYLIGLVHAFSQSIILGFLALVLPPVTVIIQIVDWVAPKELWVELGKLLTQVTG